MSLDLLARVFGLKGIAGKKQGTWMRNVVPEMEIVEVFGPKVKATWLAPRDSGLLTAVRRSVEPLLHHHDTYDPDVVPVPEWANRALVESGLGPKTEPRRVPTQECPGAEDPMTQQTELHGAEARRYADSHLEKVRTDPATWEVEYVDRKTGARWLMDYPDSGAHGGGSPRLRRLQASNPTG